MTPEKKRRAMGPFRKNSAISVLRREGEKHLAKEKGGQISVQIAREGRMALPLTRESAHKQPLRSKEKGFEKRKTGKAGLW